MRNWCRFTLPLRRSRGTTSPQTCSSPSPGPGRRRAARWAPGLPRPSRISFVRLVMSSSRNKKISTFTCRRMKMWNRSFVTFVRKPSSFQTSWGYTRSSTIPKTNLWLAIFVSVILNSLMLFKSTDKYTLLSSYLYCFIEFVYWDREGLATIHFLMQLSVTLSGRSQGMETQSGPSRGHLRRVAADSGAVKHTLYTHSFQSSPRGN